MPAPASLPNPQASARGRSHIGALLALAVVGLVTLAGFIAVLSARYSSGDGYPTYSTLRSDPLGARAIFEALARLPNVETVRNFERLDKLQGKGNQTLIMMNVDAGQFNSPKGIDGEAVQRWVLGGGRLVIALSPTSDGAKFDRLIREAEEELDDEDRQEQAKQKADDKKAKKPTAPENQSKEPAATPPEKKPVDTSRPPSKKDNAEAKLKSARKRHGIRVKHDTSLSEVLKIAAKPAESYVAKSTGGSVLTTRAALPVAVDNMPKWFSDAYLEDDPQQDFRDEWRRALASRERHRNKTEQDDKREKTDAEAVAKTKAEQAKTPVEPSPWRWLASKGQRAMILERNLGTGSVVICSDSYFFSNEALCKEPKSRFLAWLVGDSTRIIFDETHLGSFIGDEAGIMTLARRYGMHGLFISGLVLFALIIWRSATSLVPRDDAADLGLWRTGAVEGRSSASGLEGLLRRGVKPIQLLQRCFEVWSATTIASKAVSQQKRADAGNILAQAQAEKGKPPVSVPVIYRRLRDALYGR